MLILCLSIKNIFFLFVSAHVSHKFTKMSLALTDLLANTLQLNLTSFPLLDFPASTTATPHSSALQRAQRRLGRSQVLISTHAAAAT